MTEVILTFESVSMEFDQRGDEIFIKVYAQYSIGRQLPPEYIDILDKMYDDKSYSDSLVTVRILLDGAPAPTKSWLEIVLTEKYYQEIPEIVPKGKLTALTSWMKVPITWEMTGQMEHDVKIELPKTIVVRLKYCVAWGYEDPEACEFYPEACGSECYDNYEDMKRKEEEVRGSERIDEGVGIEIIDTSDWNVIDVGTITYTPPKEQPDKGWKPGKYIREFLEKIFG